ncbi:MAG: glycoside hydrolase family 3 C-terminal domain-containing protein, partial [Muribaculaceae bacterium]|nr:glycoside hydrolase family 3 C-terminal domain-containing protein [Muribaculaceae bacterium]
QGNGVADALLGKVNPAGRTTQTWVRDILDLPEIMDYDITRGRTYMYFRNKPLYPFGYGLSYTTFDYSGLKAAAKDGKLFVEFDITNSGDRDGEEVPQLYVALADENGPYKLKGFDRVAVPKGETRHVTFEIPLSELGSWNESSKNFAPPAGSRIRLAVGASSADHRLGKELKI